MHHLYVFVILKPGMFMRINARQFYHLADKFAKGFEEAYAAFQRMEDSQQDMERIPTVEEKMQLSYGNYLHFSIAIVVFFV